MTTIRFIGTRQDVSRIARTLGGILSGREPDQHGIGQGFRSALGFGALTDVKEAYITKARGGTDEMGIKWPPLAPATIANRRVGNPRGQEAKSEAIRTRERIRKREYKKALKRYMLSDLPEHEQKRRAKIVAGLKATAETGKTKVQTLGDRDVEILRDTSVLINSLSPGEFTSGQYTLPTEEGGEEQIFKAGQGEMIVGTNVIYASTHQHGDPSRNIPARPFLPDEDHPVPDVWWERWANIAALALQSSLRHLFARGA